jgi:hypothetical protein
MGVENQQLSKHFVPGKGGGRCYLFFYCTLCRPSTLSIPNDTNRGHFHEHNTWFCGAAPIFMQPLLF